MNENCKRNYTLDGAYKKFLDKIKKWELKEAKLLADDYPKILQMWMRWLTAKVFYCGWKPRLFVLEVWQDSFLSVTEIKYDARSNKFVYIRHWLDLLRLYGFDVKRDDDLEFEKVMKQAIEDFKKLETSYCNF